MEIEAQFRRNYDSRFLAELDVNGMQAAQGMFDNKRFAAALFEELSSVVAYQIKEQDWKGESCIDFTFMKTANGIDYICGIDDISYRSEKKSIGVIGSRLFEHAWKYTGFEDSTPRDRCNTSLSAINIGYDVHAIMMTAFNSCLSLKKVSFGTKNRWGTNVGSKLHYIGMFAFANCTDLESIEIPNSVSVIDSGCFCNCTSLKSVTLPKDNSEFRTIMIGCFEKSGIEYIEIPRSVIEIDSKAFAETKNLKKIVIPPSVRIISGSAFFRSAPEIVCKEGSVAHKFAVKEKLKFSFM